jgi:hypothetical protein
MNIDEGYNTLDGVRHNMTGVTAVSVGTSTTVPPFPILQMQLQAQTQARAETPIKTSISVLVTRVRNGYFVHTPEGEFVAGSIDEITKLVAVSVAALELDR